MHNVLRRLGADGCLCAPSEREVQLGIVRFRGQIPRTQQHSSGTAHEPGSRREARSVGLRCRYFQVREVDAALSLLADAKALSVASEDLALAGALAPLVVELRTSSS